MRIAAHEYHGMDRGRSDAMPTRTQTSGGSGLTSKKAILIRTGLGTRLATANF